MVVVALGIFLSHRRTSTSAKTAATELFLTSWTFTSADSAAPLLQEFGRLLMLILPLLCCRNLDPVMVVVALGVFLVIAGRLLCPKPPLLRSSSLPGHLLLLILPLLCCRSLDPVMVVVALGVF
jgi:hypothetical protein